MKPTTHAIGSCLNTSDRPICLLKVLAAAPGHFPYRNRTEFAGAAPALLAEIEGSVTTGEAELKSGPRNALDAYEGIPLLKMEEAIRATLQADRAGKPPEEALAPIRELGKGLKSHSFILGQIVTPAGAELRATAYQSVWGAYRDPKLPPEKKPRLALAKAALDAWAETQRKYGQEAERRLGTRAGALVEAYASLGDEAGARREAEALDEPAKARNIDVLLALHRLDAATEAAVALTRGDVPRKTDDPSDPLESVQGRVLAAALKGGRPDLARKVADARVRLAMAAGDPPPECWIADADLKDATSPVCSNVQALAQQMDAKARAGSGPASIRAAQWATEAWVRLGQPERGKALLELYLPRAERDAMACNDKPVCYRLGLEQMALWVGDYGTAAKMYGNVPFDLVNFDVDHGRGLTNIDAHLARTDNPAWADLALTECSNHAAQRKNWSIAKACVERLAARADRALAPHEVKLREITTDGGRPRVTAIAAALTLAGRAARAGELQLAREMTDLGLKLAQGGEASELPFLLDHSIEDVAVAELRSAKRL